MILREAGHCVFSVICPQAQQMYLVGDFNGWSRTAVRMDQVGPGLWRTALALEPGTYRFRYYTGESWLNDYAAFGLLPNGLGGWDSVVWIPAEAQRASDRMRGAVATEGSAKKWEVPDGDFTAHSRIANAPDRRGHPHCGRARARPK